MVFFFSFKEWIRTPPRILEAVPDEKKKDEAERENRDLARKPVVQKLLGKKIGRTGRHEQACIKIIGRDAESEQEDRAKKRLLQT